MENKNTFTEKDINEKFDSFKTSYSESDAKKVLANEDKIKKIMKNDKLAEFFEYVVVYFKMLKDTFTGRYKNVPFGTIAAIVGTLAYVLSPIDLIPDVIPIVGYLDDAAVLAMCVKLTKFDVDRYKRETGQA